MRYEILYPERRYVSADTIEGWFADAVADGLIDLHYLGAKSTEEKDTALDDAGIITMGRGRQ